MFKNLKLATKIGLGFSLLILIACLLGVLSIFNMKRVEVESKKLAQEYVPEVELANNVERHSLLTMYAMRGYGLSENQQYLQEGRKNLEETENYINDCQKLADESKHLVKLKEAVVKCRENVNIYKELVNQTVDRNSAID